MTQKEKGFTNNVPVACSTTEDNDSEAQINKKFSVPFFMLKALIFFHLPLQSI